MDYIKLLLRKFKIIEISILFFLLTDKPITAQIVPDATLPSNSVTTEHGSTISVEGGTTKGSNLFHSFEQFSIPTGDITYFNNALDIQNIFSRVTGLSVSNIDGVIRANGTANLFFINPNGIIFGPNASLDIGGSFVGSTASSINFADGTQFSATAPQTTPLLKISVPTGLQFGSNPGAIRVQGVGYKLINSPFSPITEFGISIGLQVNSGRTLAIIGGDLILDGSVVTAEEGRIELGSVGTGLVNLRSTIFGWSLGYEDVLSFKDIQLSQQALVNASGASSGSVQVQGANVIFTDGSAIWIQNQGFQTSGDINVNASNFLELSGTSLDGKMPSGLVSETVLSGDAGNIVVSSPQVVLQNGGVITARTFSEAAGGDLTVITSEFIQLIGSAPTDPRLVSGIGAVTFNSGDAGNIVISAKQLTALNGGVVTSLTFGTGSGGDVSVNATDFIEINGVNRPLFTSSGLGSSGNFGNSSDIEVNTSRLLLQNGGKIIASTTGSGISGNIKINASESVEVTGTTSGSAPGSVISSAISSSAQVVDQALQQALGLPIKPSGVSGEVEITTQKLSITNGGQVSVQNEGTGNAENSNIELNVGNLQLRNGSDITATSEDGGSSGGNITINADTLVALEDSDITADAFGGFGGTIQINAQGIFGTEARSKDTPESDITASSGVGVDGDIEINTLDFDARNTLTPLTSNFVSTEQVVAGSCLARRNAQQGSFVVTGSGGLPTTPYSGITEWDTLTGVQSQTRSNLSEARSQPTSSQLSFQGVQEKYPPSWKPGDPIIEAQGIVVTTDGRTSLGMEPQQAATANPETLICSAASSES